MRDKDSSRSEPPSVHYLDQSEFIELLVSRRRLARVWLRNDLLVRNSKAVRDLQTGVLNVARETPR